MENILSLQPNHIIGNYRIVRPLGEGGMATVYEVEHLKLGVHYALKTFTLQEGHVELFRKRFSVEGKILARLNHPNLVRVIDLDIDEVLGVLYYVMDLVLYSDGETHTLADIQPGAADEAQISLDNPDAGLDIPCNFDAGDELDLKWRLARHEAAVDHALTKTALSQQSKDIYRAYVIDEEPLKTVAKRFGVSENTVAQTKTRVNKMIAALEEGVA